jgi:hypothetical protein
MRKHLCVECPLKMWLPGFKGTAELAVIVDLPIEDGQNGPSALAMAAPGGRRVNDAGRVWTGGLWP